MKTTATAILLVGTLFLGACQTDTPIETENDVITPTVDNLDASNVAGWEETQDNGDFSFKVATTASAYTIDVLYKGESVGVIEKELPVDGYEIRLMEESGSKAFFALNATGRGGYILYKHVDEVYVYDSSAKTFETLPVASVDDISSDGNLVAYWDTRQGGTNVWGLSVYDLQTGTDVSTYIVMDEFDEGGRATFSPSGKNLAFELADKDDEENGEEHGLFVGESVGGEFKEMGRQVNEYFSMDWEANETLKNFEAANQ